MSIRNAEAKRFALNFAIAGCASTFAKTVTSPFDRVKLILQTQRSSLPIITGERQLYTGIIDCFRRIPEEQGFWSFWRGNGINILRYFPCQALNFSFYDFFKRRMYSVWGEDGTEGTIIRFVAGGIAGACSTFIVFPIEFCQTKVSVDIGADKSRLKHQLVEREYTGFRDCLKKTCRVSGFKGIYKGCGVVLLGVALYRSFYFGLFDLIKRIWARDALNNHNEMPKPPFLTGLFFAQCATCISGSITYPLDTIGRRLMMESGRQPQYRLFDGTNDAVKYMYKNEGGVRALYRGIVANFLRGLSGALVLVLYDEILHYTNWKQTVLSDSRK